MPFDIRGRPTASTLPTAHHHERCATGWLVTSGVAEERPTSGPSGIHKRGSDEVNHETRGPRIHARMAQPSRGEVDRALADATSPRRSTTNYFERLH